MPTITPEQARATRRRRAILSWVPIGLIALGLLAVAVTAATSSGWWWFQQDPSASADQAAPDGSTLFTGPGVDYLTVDGVLRVKVRDDAPSAVDLGLDADGERAVDPRVPIRAIVSAPDGGFAVDLVDTVDVVTSDDRIVQVSLATDSPGDFRAALAELRDEATRWGWSLDQVDALEQQLVDGLAAGGATSASLEPVPMHGARVWATVDAAGAGARIVYTVASAAE